MGAGVNSKPVEGPISVMGYSVQQSKVNIYLMIIYDPVSVYSSKYTSGTLRIVIRSNAKSYLYNKLIKS